MGRMMRLLQNPARTRVDELKARPIHRIDTPAQWKELRQIEILRRSALGKGGTE